MSELMVWSSEELDVLRRTIAVGTTDDEFALFCAVARRSGLDPFARQIHAVKRWDNRAGREVMTIQTGIDGLRLIGHRTHEVEGVDGPWWCGPDGQWRDVWLGAEHPSAAKVTIYRAGVKRGFTAVALMSESAQTTKTGALSVMWAQRPAAMLAKCAEALAWRMAFPAELVGLLATEELDGVADERPVNRGDERLAAAATAALAAYRPAEAPQAAVEDSASVDAEEGTDSARARFPLFPAGEWQTHAREHGVKLTNEDLRKTWHVTTWRDPGLLPAEKQAALWEWISDQAGRDG